MGIDNTFSPGSALYAGSEYKLGYDFDKSLAIRLEFNYFSYNNYGNSTSALLTKIRFIPEFKLTLNPGLVKPYGLLGLGLDIEGIVQKEIGTSFLYPDLLAGTGVDVELFNWLSLFAEAKLSLILTNGSLGTDLSLTGGPHFSF